MILAILLGPHAGFLTMASVLAVQALFFADGGLMALGCNIFNLGFFPCFIAYPLIFKNIAGPTLSERRLFAAAIISAIAGLQLGAFSVVLQTLFSGVTELSLVTFVLMMQPIHLAIGIVEGLATSAVGVCKRAIVIHQGNVTADGLTLELLQDEALLEKSGLEKPLQMQNCPVCGQSNPTPDPPKLTIEN